MCRPFARRWNGCSCKRRERRSWDDQKTGTDLFCRTGGNRRTSADLQYSSYIDAAYVWNSVLGKLLADGKVLTDSGKLAEQGIITADLGLVRTDFAQKYPDIVAKYIKIQQKAHDLYQSNPDEAAAAIAQGLNIEKADALQQTRELIWVSAKDQLGEQYLGTSAGKGNLAKVLKATADFLVEQKAIDKAPDQSVFDQAVNPKYIESALK